MTTPDLTLMQRARSEIGQLLESNQIYIEQRVLYSYIHDQLYKHIIHLHMHAHLYAEHNDDTIETSDTVLRKIYLTLIERVVCERELETEQNCNILTPHSYGHQRFFQRSPALLNRRPEGPALCWVLAFSTTSYLQLI